MARTTNNPKFLELIRISEKEKNMTETKEVTNFEKNLLFPINIEVNRKVPEARMLKEGSAELINTI